MSDHVVLLIAGSLWLGFGLGKRLTLVETLAVVAGVYLIALAVHQHS